MRALLLPLAAMLALATGVGLLGVAATVNVEPIVRPVATAIPDMTATPASDGVAVAEPLLADASVELPAGAAALRLARLGLPPGTGLPSRTASGPALLAVERGTASVRSEGAVWVGHGLDAAQVETTLHPGERIVVAPGVFYAVRNDGPASAVVLVVTIEPDESRPDGETAIPLAGSLRGD
jgi:quercetin dioxygenase-like cupin family protein